VRSGWEDDIVNRLTNHCIEYRYEQMEINYGNRRTETPDFVTSDSLIEVKGRLFESGSGTENQESESTSRDGVSLRLSVCCGWNETSC
jgi:hypothetical protein